MLIDDLERFPISETVLDQRVSLGSELPDYQAGGFADFVVGRRAFCAGLRVG